jgi:hypothetical protein
MKLQKKTPQYPIPKDNALQGQCYENFESLMGEKITIVVNLLYCDNRHVLDYKLHLLNNSSFVYISLFLKLLFVFFITLLPP